MTKENINNVKKEKLTNVSLIRLFATVIIFVFHVILVTTDIASQYFPFYFAVQIFLFISGFLYAGKVIKNLKDFYFKNLVKLCVPVFVMFAIYLAVCGILYACGNPWSISSVSPSGQPVETFGHLWFVYGIFLCYLITPIIQYVSRVFIDKEEGLNKKKAICFLVILFVSSAINIVLGFFGSQMVLLAYIVGYFFGKVYPQILINKKLFTYISLLFFLIFSVIFFVVGSYISLTGNICVGIKEFLVFLIGSSFSVFALLALEFLNHIPLRDEEFLKLSDYYSYSFYMCHHLFLVGQGGLVFIALTNSLLVNISLVFMASLLFCVIVGLISKKIVPQINKIPNFFK